MRLIKDCPSRIKGRCTKAGTYCCFIPSAELKTCTVLGAPDEKKKGKEKKK